MRCNSVEPASGISVPSSSLFFCFLLLLFNEDPIVIFSSSKWYFFFSRGLKLLFVTHLFVEWLPSGSAPEWILDSLAVFCSFSTLESLVRRYLEAFFVVPPPPLVPNVSLFACQLLLPFQPFKAVCGLRTLPFSDPQETDINSFISCLGALSTSWFHTNCVHDGVLNKQLKNMF